MLNNLNTPFVVALAAAAASTTALAAPLIHSRDDGSGCTSLGKGPLGFNASSIGIYNYYEPEYHLTFNNSPTNRYGDNYLLANLAHAYDDPEFFELISCKYTPPKYQGKGSIEVYQGYIKTADGQCIQRTEVDSTEGQFSKKPCAYSLNDLTGDSAAQHFQFSEDTFYSYYSVSFLGSEEGPTAKANTSFHSGGQYKLSAVGLPNSSNQRFIEAEYQQGVEQPGNANVTMIAQVGTEYAPQRSQFPDCTLVKTGSLSYTDGTTGLQHPVSLESVSLSYYDHGLIPVLNGTESSDGFEFYQCDSYYMGYGEQKSTDIVKYGHLVTTQDEGDCFLRNTDTSEGASPDLIISNSYNSGCGTADNKAQLITFYSFNSSSGEIYFLGSRASDNQPPLSWTLSGNNVTLSNTSTTNTLRFV